MKICILLICINFGGMLLWPFLFAQVSNPELSFNDGPYLFFEESGLVARWISDGTLKVDTARAGRPLKIDADVSESFDVSYLDLDNPFKLSPVTAFKGVEDIAVVSDVHGQYQLMLSLLKAHGIIDISNNWAFGQGHFVVLGDIFDRGDEVTEILWFVHNLEKQAEKAGGKVHYLLGNHEVMVLQNDLRYIHKKYRYSMALTGITYNDLFGKNTYLGRWLRSKPVAITINNIAFVHAGISGQVLQRGLSFHEMNTLFQERIIDQDEEKILADSILADLYLDDGPVWYRGYFNGDFSLERTQNLLHRLKVKHIVVGHTSFPEIVSLHRRKIIGVDSSIKTGERGEILLYSKGKFYRGDLESRRIKLK
jgi:hypothetical protein